jgi:hypothetical protein
MRTFKIVDVTVQALLLLSLLVVVLSQQFDFGTSGGDTWFFGGYFVLGGWQVMSCLVHVASPQYRKRTGRRVYYVLLGLALLFLLISIVFSDMLIAYLFVMLFVSPFIAAFYWVMSMIELMKMKQQTIV